MTNSRLIQPAAEVRSAARYAV